MAGGKHEIITTRLNALAAYLLAIRGWGVSQPLGMSAKKASTHVAPEQHATAELSHLAALGAYEPE